MDGMPLSSVLSQISLNNKPKGLGEIGMGKKRNHKPQLVGTEEQAKNAVLVGLDKLMRSLDSQGVDDKPAAALMIFILGAYLLKSGNVPMFDDSVRQLTKHYPEFFDIQDDDSGDDTFH